MHGHRFARLTAMAIALSLSGVLVVSETAVSQTIAKATQYKAVIGKGKKRGGFGPGNAAWNAYYSDPTNTSTWAPYCAGGGGTVVKSADGVPACGPTGSTIIILKSPHRLTIETPGFQCVELSDRFLYVHWGYLAKPGNGDQVVASYGRGYRIPVVTNGTVGSAPQVSDVMSFSANSNFQDSDGGHTGVVVGSSVNSSGNGSIMLLDENDNDTAGLNTIAVSNWVVQSYGPYSYIEWLGLTPA